MSGWIPQTLAYIVLLAAAGLTANLAYSAIFVATGTRFPLGVTVIGSALFLSEKITLIRGVGTALVVAGVVLRSR